MGKPRICEILGVDVEKQFVFRGSKYCVGKDGKLRVRHNNGFEFPTVADILAEMINNPEEVKSAKNPQLTEDEKAVLRQIYKARMNVLPCGYVLEPSNLIAVKMLLPSLDEHKTYDIRDLYPEVRQW